MTAFTVVTVTLTDPVDVGSVEGDPLGWVAAHGPELERLARDAARALGRFAISCPTQWAVFVSADGTPAVVGEVGADAVRRAYGEDNVARVLALLEEAEVPTAILVAAVRTVVRGVG